MGDRGAILSVSKVNKQGLPVAGTLMYSHWGGWRLLDTCLRHAKVSGRNDVSYFTANLFVKVIADGVRDEMTLKTPAGFDAIELEGAKEALLEALGSSYGKGLDPWLPAKHTDPYGIEHPLIVIDIERARFTLLPLNYKDTIKDLLSKCEWVSLDTLTADTFRYGDFHQLVQTNKGENHVEYYA